LLRELKSRGLAEVRVATDIRYTSGPSRSATHEGVDIHGAERQHCAETIAQEIRSFRPSAILTQLIWADVALRVGRDLGVPTILRVPSLPLNLDIRTGAALEPTALMALTPFVQRRVSEEFGRTPFVIPSAIDVTRALVPSGAYRPRFITMFNPIDLKGGFVFREIARQMPDREFLAVRGWHSLRRPDGTWDQDLISRSPETYGEPYRGWLPEDVDLSDVPNVTMMEPRERVSEIFAVTRILLVPSMWAEALARVSVEAFANGIPVIVSAVGSLADHGRRGGIAVDEFRDAGAWTRTIRQLDDPALRADCVERGRRVAREEFSLDRAVGAFADLLGRVVAVPRGARLDAT
jgi:hypothetical protein